ncbi:hypothetical protein PM076_13560 [Halorubrum ezzemoulense]|jgi:hypothetical protein|uniref:Uncharacterized protein n=1 Tax=Halorubrum ezzemoulense TaxID=337243 RepID=A0A256J4V2_HALEZ|nr:MULTISPECIES: hypothetical protein [Halorubrum]MDB2226393.1 hypothetical protein [Halorubrum ezzemoulense]MDB2239087.1 hypothetical protein [Halorubrum ezzemoulense]MDB2242886.1 hypothetical protein [Halorubrum ezzemoulense]MDB2245735.1 hypothetical protein [Halorubrum ezzemoulense]MDB2248636.1 hypothetical protein [Halorubrum ezzemoulense]
MSDSLKPDTLDAKHDGDWQQRITAIKRWVAYINAEPPETWGPQQNAVVNGQLTAAQHVATSAAHQQHVTAVAQEIRDLQESDTETSTVRDDHD